MYLLLLEFSRVLSEGKLILVCAMTPNQACTGIAVESA